MSGLTEPRRNPFVGPRPIQLGEKLYGRKTEVRELFEQLQGRRIVVLHSPSGAGKSSLVSAGLIPRLREAKFDVWRPIRVNLDVPKFENASEKVNRYLFSAVASLEDEVPTPLRRSPAELAKLGFLDYLDNRARRKIRTQQSVVLIFDQFEEILSVDPHAIEAKRAFFSAVGAALDTGRYWALFVIREDFLAALAPYRDLIPTQLSNTYRLDLLGLAGAREAAEKLAEESGRSFPAADRLIRDLSVVQVQQSDGSFVAEQGIHVEPVYLQVVCRRLWAAMPNDATTIDEASVEAYAQVSKSLAGYYAEAVAAIAGGDVALERSIRDWVGTRLIVGGIRTPVRQQLGPDQGIEFEHITQLLDQYVIRSEQRAGANWYELSHDRLVEPVLEDNTAWHQSHLHPLQVQAELWEDGGRSRALLLGADALPDAEAWAAKNSNLLTSGDREFLDLSRVRRAEELAARRRLWLFAGLMTAVAVVAMAFAVLAILARDQAEEARDAAEKAEAAALQDKQKAQRAELAAMEAQAAAETAQTEAEEALAQAEKSQAEKERSLRQRLEVAMRPLTKRLIEKRMAAGVVEFDERWTPLLAHDDRTIVAASLGEDFHIVVAGHEAALSQGDSLFLESTAQWLLDNQLHRKVAIVTQRDADPRLQDLERNLLRLEYEYDVYPSLTNPEVLAEVGMLILFDLQTRELGADEKAVIESFLDRGGGVLAIGHAKSWIDAKGLADGSQSALDNYPMNAALAVYGVRWSEATVSSEELGQREGRVIVRFVNDTGEDVDVYARSDGQEKLYTTLAPKEARDLLTTMGSEWFFRGFAEKDHQWARINGENQIVRIDWSAPPLPDTLSRKHVESQAEKAKRAVWACGSKHDTIADPLAEVDLKIDPNGKVTSASVRPPVRGTPEAACIEAKIEKIEFPPSLNGGKFSWRLWLVDFGVQ